MASAGSVNPLDIPEILFCVGKFIPLWIPDDSKYAFQPRDLLAAIAVNRTFHRTLTPLLWVVCTDYIILPDIFERIKGHYTPPLELLLSCSHHFRFLETSIRSIDIHFQCTHLQELKLSEWVDRDVGMDLVSMNKGLTVLSWDFPILASGTMQGKEYVALGGLKKLKVLQMKGWIVDLDRFLTAALAPIAAVLEELSLSDIIGLDTTRAWSTNVMRSTSNVGTPFTTAIGTTTLPKLRTLLLECDGDLVNSGIDREVLEVIRICPNLETLIIQQDHRCNMEKIGRYLRDHCPKLSAIRCMNGHTFVDGEIAMDNEGYVALIQGCVPPSSSKSLSTVDSTRHEGQGLRVFEMGLGWLDSTLTGALMAHSDCLETLILYIRSDKVENFNNACQLLSRCRHLQKFGLYNYQITLSPDDGMLLFQEPWACRGLKSLALSTFQSRFEDEQDETPDDLQGQRLHRYFKAFDYYPEVVDENAFDDDQISGRDSSEQSPMGDISRNAVLEITRYLNVTRGDETLLGNWHRSTANMNDNDDLLSGQGFAFKRKFFQVANSLPSLENVSLNYIDYVRGSAHEVPLK
ncbi:hypothetical protein BGZ58_002902 [Dissophora ornata]|nr:hypothetical protein BGZ58_002902 [Dissophora ornata]